MRRHQQHLYLLAHLFLTGICSASDSAVGLIYHRLGEDQYPETSISIEQSEAQLEFLNREGHFVVPLEDLVAALTEGKALPPNAVAITIDDT